MDLEKLVFDADRYSDRRAFNRKSIDDLGELDVSDLGRGYRATDDGSVVGDALLERFAGLLPEIGEHQLIDPVRVDTELRLEWPHPLARVRPKKRLRGVIRTRGLPVDLGEI